MARDARRKPELKLGVCGEHGGDPDSIDFLHALGHRLRLVLALPRADRARRRRTGGYPRSRLPLAARRNERNGQSPTELCAGLDMARQSVTKHLAVLEAATLVATGRWSCPA